MMPQLGIAIATTLGGWLNAYLLWSTLRERNDFTTDARLRRNVPLIVVASLAMVAGLLFASHRLAPYLAAGSGFVEKTSALGIEIVFGLAVFGVVIMASGVMSIRQLGTLIGRGGKG